MLKQLNIIQTNKKCQKLLDLTTKEKTREIPRQLQMKGLIKFLINYL